jgi:diacylglycerol kinase (ATP)
MIDTRKVLRSFRFAGQGIVDLFRFENNAKVHGLAALAVLGLGLWLDVGRIEWALLITQIGLVWASEAVNTALEKLCDHVTPDRHPQIKAIKDMASGAVLIMAFTAAAVGSIILGSHLIDRFF